VAHAIVGVVKVIVFYVVDVVDVVDVVVVVAVVVVVVAGTVPERVDITQVVGPSETGGCKEIRRRHEKSQEHRANRQFFFQQCLDLHRSGLSHRRSPLAGPVPDPVLEGQRIEAKDCRADQVQGRKKRIVPRKEGFRARWRGHRKLLQLLQLFPVIGGSGSDSGSGSNSRRIPAFIPPIK